jgi:hypothetical protein
MVYAYRGSDTLPDWCKPLLPDSDPRRPEKFVPMKRITYDPDDTPQDWNCLFALVLGVAALYLQHRDLSWVALAVALSFLASYRDSEFDTKQGITGVAMCIGAAFASTVRQYFAYQRAIEESTE